MDAFVFAVKFGPFWGVVCLVVVVSCAVCCALGCLCARFGVISIRGRCGVCLVCWCALDPQGFCEFSGPVYHLSFFFVSSLFFSLFVAVNSWMRFLISRVFSFSSLSFLVFGDDRKSSELEHEGIICSTNEQQHATTTTPTTTTIELMMARGHQYFEPYFFVRVVIVWLFGFVCKFLAAIHSYV